MRKGLIIFHLLLCLGAVNGQIFKKETDSLEKRYRETSGERERINYLNNIINSSLPDNPQYSDSLAGVMLNIAEFSRDRELMCRAYFDLAQQYINYSSLRNNREVGEQYANKLLELAKASNLEGYVITAYLRLAQINRIKSNNQKALELNNLAISLAVNLGSDSISCLCYTSIANTWMDMNNKLAAFQSRLTAREFAEKSKTSYLLLQTMQNLADFYSSIDENEKAKDIFFQCMPLARQNKEWEFLMIAQRSLASLYIQSGQNSLGMHLYDDAMHIADSVGREGYKINIYIDILNYLLNHESAEKALAYLAKEPVMRTFLIQTGSRYELDKLAGFNFYQKKHYDSAEYYFLKAMPFVNASRSPANEFDFFQIFAEMYKERKMADKQFTYLSRCNSIADSSGNIELQSKIALVLDSFYLTKGDYKSAFQQYSRYNLYADSLKKLSEQRGLLSLEIENENKRKIKQQEEREMAIRVKDNIQYMGITAAIAVVFIMLVVLGAFKISIPLIKGLGFIAFIFLFEFIILLADRYIHHLTDGEPWKILSLKIILIAMLYPLHHWLEHRVIQYLVTNDLLKGKKLRLSFWGKKEKNIAITNQ